MSLQTLIFRADASVAIGTGHVMRCLALAQAWQDAGGHSVFAVAQITPKVEGRLLSEGMEIVRLAASSGSEVDAAGLVHLAQEKRADWVVVDGYVFSAAYQRTLQNTGFKQLFIDDTGHARSYCADLVLDQNAHAKESFYAKREAGTQLLLGSRYALLRREFAAWQGWQREISPVGRRVLVTMGGSDPENVSGVVVQALRLIKSKEIQVTMLVGGSNPHLASLEAAIQDSPLRIEVEKNVRNMAELMAQADVAVSSAGTTCWELCLLGLPALLTDLAPNQHPVAGELERRGAAVYLGSGQKVTATEIAEKLDWLLASAESRTSMSQRGRKLVDGRGAARVVAAIRNHGLRLRPVQASDCRLLWQWVNDPQVREASFTRAAIDWSEHTDWFDKKLRDPGCMMFIATDEYGSPWGQIRCEGTSSGEAFMDVSVAKENRGRGLGTNLIDMAVQCVFAQNKWQRLHAWIRPDNQASQRAFETAGFVPAGAGQFLGHSAVHYVRDKSSHGASD